MALQTGEQYRCPDRECVCEIEVTKGATPGKGGDHAPRGGMEMEKGGMSLTHRILEVFYEAMQFQGGKAPERDPQKNFPPGYRNLPGRVYGDSDYQVLPEERAKEAEKRA